MTTFTTPPGQSLTILVDGQPTECELLFTDNGDGKGELAYRPLFSDPWRMWSPPVRLEREPLPAAATRTRKPGLCTCGQPGCSDGAVRR